MTWSTSEIQDYLAVRRKELGPVYVAAGIGIIEPEKRAEYLAEQLKLTPTDHDVIMRVSLKEGKAKALKLLEDMAVEFFF